MFVRYLSCIANSCPAFSCPAISFPAFSVNLNENYLHIVVVLDLHAKGQAFTDLCAVDNGFGAEMLIFLEYDSHLLKLD